MTTRQQQMQERVAQLLFDWLDCKDMDCIDNDDAARNILSYLDKEGMAMEVDRELPFDCVDCHHHRCYPSPKPKDCTCELDAVVVVCTEGIPEKCPLKAGYGTFERLIEDGH